jgi:hypothetical protein
MVQPHTTELVHLHDIQPRSAGLQKWERVRHGQARWFVECLAEAVNIPVCKIIIESVLMLHHLDGHVHLLLCGRIGRHDVHHRQPRQATWRPMYVLICHILRCQQVDSLVPIAY